MFAHWFLKERKKAGSRKAVAEKLGVTPEQLKKVEEGEELPTAPLLARCVRAGMDVTYILTGQVQKGPQYLEEASLISGWRAASGAVRAAVMALLALSLHTAPLGGTACSRAAECIGPPAACALQYQPPAPQIHIHGRDSHVAVSGGRVTRKG